jgi:adenosylcobinamide kinase/adenosylcobinamide-phosphate guanylyltransferase
MAERIRRHQEERGAAFQTIEEPLALDLLLEKIRGTCSIAVVDCLTMWLSNLLGDLGEDLFRIQQSMNDLLSALQGTDVPLILIGNEVGWGIVPDNRLARTFRDLNGSLNQEIARIADQVILMAAGIPLVIKR